ncbi:hypothetical protein [Methylopila turkensis]|uniref:Uncharacterized protein n=1 Tax=Methylopila turkensis TaxID=1437816 RepID=A0A9W6N876_9HYPH|nr:hypothetical protein [Methylopila turkensis]GLK81268.1 hypothetical protein GCM10008174_30090 [Methylopila turkensis]
MALLASGALRAPYGISALFLVILSAFVACAVPALAQGPNDPPPGGRASSTPSASDLGMALMSAVVRADGTLARGEGVESSAVVGLSHQYEVIFGRDVTACAYTVDIGGFEPFGIPPKGVAAVIGRAGNVRGVYVETFRVDGAELPLGFHVLVFCGR